METTLNITDLPNEVLLNIFKYLSYRDVISTRSVCHSFYNLSVQTGLTQNEVLTISEDNIQELSQTLAKSNRCFKTIKFQKIIFSSQFLSLIQKYYESVTHLIFIDCDIDSTDFHELILSTKNLITLSISTCRSLLMHLSFNPLEQHPTIDKLKHLNLPNCSYLTDSVFSKIISLFPNITSLRLNNNEICFHFGLCKRFYKDINEYIHTPSNLIFTIFYITQTIKERAEQIKHLDISSTNIDFKSISNLLTIEGLKLEKLGMNHCRQLSQSTFLELGSWQPSITELNLCTCRAVTDDTLANICTNMKRLKRLDIEDCPITNVGLTFLSYLRELKDLNVSNCEGITSSGLLSGLNKDGTLTVLKARHLRIDNINIDDLVECFVNLEELDLSDCYQMSDNHLNYILWTCSKLIRFTLTACRSITDEGCIYTGSSQLKDEEINKNQGEVKKPLLGNPQGLVLLNLQGCKNLTDRTFKFGLHLEHLRVLNLNSTSITSATLYYIASRCPRIEDLNVGYASMNDESACFVLETLKRLDYLDVSNCSKLTNGFITSLMKIQHPLKELNVKGCYTISSSLLDKLDSSNLVKKTLRSLDTLSKPYMIFVPPPPKSPTNINNI